MDAGIPVIKISSIRAEIFLKKSYIEATFHTIPQYWNISQIVSLTRKNIQYAHHVYIYNIAHIQYYSYWCDELAMQR